MEMRASSGGLPRLFISWTGQLPPPLKSYTHLANGQPQQGPEREMGPKQDKEMDKPPQGGETESKRITGFVSFSYQG